MNSFKENSDVIIRRVTAADVAAIAPAVSDIYKYYVEQTTVSFEHIAPSASEMCARLEEIAAEHPCFVAESAEGLAGYAYVHPWKVRPAYNRTLETTIYLRHGMTSRGVGRRLMLSLIEACRLTDCHALIACITHENDGSLRFHESLGFRTVSEFKEVGYKFGRYLDVTDMELIL